MTTICIVGFFIVAGLCSLLVLCALRRASQMDEIMSEFEDWYK